MDLPSRATRSFGAAFSAAVTVLVCGMALASPRPPAPEVEPNDGRGATPRGQVTLGTRPLPSGRAVGRLGPARCISILRSRGVAFEEIDADDVPGVRIPVRLLGPIGGIDVVSSGPSANNSIYDCRLVVALLAWSPDLRASRVVRVEHMSTYRPGARVAGTGTESGHAAAMAIDVGRFGLADGTVLDVLTTWSSPALGTSPCSHPDEESEQLRTLRSLICRTIETDLFQIVLTPHFDHVHRNHVHLELRPDVEWSYVR